MDRILVLTDGNAMMFMAVAAALQHFIVHNVTRNKKYEPQFTILGNDSIKFLLPLISADAKLIDNLDGLQCSDFDMIADLRHRVIYDLAKVNQKHCVAAMGIVIGSHGHPLPELGMMNPWREKSQDFLILPSCMPHGKIAILQEILAVNFPQATVRVVEPPAYGSPEEMFDMVCKSSVVFGRRGFETYVAAALNKVVVEVYPPDAFARYLSKWTAPGYQMLFTNPETVTPALMYQAMESAICRQVPILSPDLSHLKLDQTEQSTSDAQIVVGK